MKTEAGHNNIYTNLQLQRFDFFPWLGVQLDYFQVIAGSVDKTLRILDFLDPTPPS